MPRPNRVSSIIVVLAASITLIAAPLDAGDSWRLKTRDGKDSSRLETRDGKDWPQWGGVNRNFTAASKGLAASWPAGGPRTIWSRDLGEGYSAIIAEGDRIYTMYRDRPNEVIIAMDAATGKTIWEYRYEAKELPGMNLEYGPGPHATPLIAGDRLFAAGAMGKFTALDKRDGKLLWSHDLHQEFV